MCIEGWAYNAGKERKCEESMGAVVEPVLGNSKKVNDLGIS